MSTATARWWTGSTIAVVTGGNKGIGFEIVRKLAQEGLTVVLTARNQQLGLDAIAKLKSHGLTVFFHPLDVLSQASISQLADWLKQQYNGLDILVNNAAITDSNPGLSSAMKVLDTNYKAVKEVTKHLLPLLRPSHAGARIVNVSSSLGQLEWLKDPALREEIGTFKGLTEEKIDTFADKYLHDVKEQKALEMGWPNAHGDGAGAYIVSKIVLNAYTRVLAGSLKDRPAGKHIYVNCVNPGYCKTDLNQNKGRLTAEEGAETPVWVALLPPDGPSGQFFSSKHQEQF